MWSHFILSLFVLVAPIQGYTNTYYGDKGVHLQIDSRGSWEKVESILRDFTQPQDIDVWKFPDKNRGAVILVKGYAFDDVTAAFDKEGLAYDLTIPDVGKFLDSIDEELSPPVNADIVGTYANYSETLEWMDSLASSYPALVSVQDVGVTYEGRPHRMLKLSNGVGSGKWNVYVEGGMHAREWVSPTTVNYITDQLIQGYVSGSPEVLAWFDLLDWYIVPVANPDGYDYTFTNDRLWRKNRRPNSGSACVGTDLNRNWSFEWGGVGSSTNPCEFNYRGPSPESEVEVQNLANFIMSDPDSFILYMAYHSWGQQFFTRWDYSANVTDLPPDHEELLDLAQRAVEAITAVNGVYYEAGIAPEIMYAFSGSSADWARGVADIKYPYLEELRDNGTYSFILPEDQILPTGAENWAGFQVVIREIQDKCTGVAPPGPCNP